MDLEEEDISTEYLSREEAEEFLLNSGADPEDLEQALGDNEEFELQIIQEGDKSRFSIAPVPDHVTENVHNFLNESLGMALAKNFAFLDWLDDHTWNVDVGEGLLSLGHDRTYPIQVLGTESAQSETWLWSWANERSNLPEELIQAALAVRDYGFENQMFELAKATFSLSRITGHEISLLATTLFDDTLYFPCPYEGGCMYVLVEDVPMPPLELCSGPRIVTVVQQIIDCPFVNHFQAVSCFLMDQGFVSESKEDAEIFTSERGVIVTLTLTETGSLTCDFHLPQTSV